MEKHQYTIVCDYCGKILDENPYETKDRKYLSVRLQGDSNNHSCIYYKKSVIRLNEKMHFCTFACMANYIQSLENT